MFGEAAIEPTENSNTRGTHEEMHKGTLKKRCNGRAKACNVETHSECTVKVEWNPCQREPMGERNVLRIVELTRERMTERMQGK